MYNLTEVSRKSNNLRSNLIGERKGKSVLSSSVELNFNTPNINNLKSALENKITPMNINRPINKLNAFPLISKSPILIKDKMNGVIIKILIIKLLK